MLYPGGEQKHALMLSDRDLEAALQSGELEVGPIERSQIQPASIDLRLSGDFAVLPPPHPLFAGYIDPCSPPTEEYVRHRVEPGKQFPLGPLERCNASTVEAVAFGPGLSGQVAGKSSLARAGLATEQAGFCDPGFAGTLTLELFNTDRHRTFFLTPGMLICQMIVFRLDSPCLHPYGSKSAGSHYMNQRGPTPSRAHLKGGSPCQDPTRSSRSLSPVPSAGQASPRSGIAPTGMP